MTNPTPTCAHCGGAIHYAKGDKESDNFTPGNYRVIGILRTGRAASYGRASNHCYPNVYAHLGTCLDAWRAASGEPTNG